MLNEELKRIKRLMMVESTEPLSTPTKGGESGSSATKWDSGVSRGKSNPVGNTKWESGITRGNANQIGVTKWVSGVKRGKGNTLS